MDSAEIRPPRGDRLGTYSKAFVLGGMGHVAMCSCDRVELPERVFPIVLSRLAFQGAEGVSLFAAKLAITAGGTVIATKSWEQRIEEFEKLGFYHINSVSSQMLTRSS